MLDAALDAPGSTGAVARFFVDAEAPLRTRALDDRRAELVNAGTEPVRATVTYAAPDGRELRAERVVAAGETVVARVVEGRLVTAGPELEPLTEAAARIAALRADVAAWRADGTLDRGQAAWLAAASAAVAHELDRALAAAERTEPDTTRAARATRAAGVLLLLLRGHALPEPVAQRLAAERAAVGALLDRALDHLAVVMRLDVLDPLVPGETARVRAVVLNRSEGTATGGRLDLEVPAGWTVAPDPAPVAPVPAGASRAVALAVTVARDARPGDEVTLTGRLAHRVLGSPRTATATAGGRVRAVVAVEALQPDAPLAAGGYNRLELQLTNGSGRAHAVELAAAAAEGVTAELDPPRVDLAPGESRTVAVRLRNAGRAEGTSELAVVARTESGAEAGATIVLHHSDNLARNGLGAPWPAASASGSQEAFPPALATDGAPGTFWVSDGTQRGDGPTPERPKLLAVDFGAPVTVREVRMVPRAGYGPRAYTIEASGDGTTWQAVAAVPAAPNAAVTTTFAPVEARALRLRITDGHDAQRPPAQRAGGRAGGALTAAGRRARPRSAPSSAPDRAGRRPAALAARGVHPRGGQGIRRSRKRAVTDSDKTPGRADARIPVHGTRPIRSAR